MIAGRQVLADGEPQPRASAPLSSKARRYPSWARRDGVPARLVSGLPQVEPVVMHAHAAEIFRAGFLVELHQVVGIELVGLPGGDHVLESEFRGVAVGLHVIFVLPVALDVHVAGVPVAVLGGGLRSPMRPDAELGVAIPGGNLPVLERFARALERAGRDLGNSRGSARESQSGSGSHSKPMACLLFSMRFALSFHAPATTVSQPV